jgi:hypothetical protein
MYCLTQQLFTPIISHDEVRNYTIPWWDKYTAHLPMSEKNVVTFRSFLTRGELNTDDYMKVFTVETILHRVFFTFLVLSSLIFLFNERLLFYSSFRNCGTCAYELCGVVSTGEFHSLILIDVTQFAVLGIGRYTPAMFCLESVDFDNNLQDF